MQEKYADPTGLHKREVTTSVSLKEILTTHLDLFTLQHMANNIFLDTTSSRKNRDSMLNICV